MTDYTIGEQNYLFVNAKEREEIEEDKQLTNNVIHHNLLLFSQQWLLDRFSLLYNVRIRREKIHLKTKNNQLE